MPTADLTPIQAVQTRGRWRWWALLVVVVLVMAAIVGAVIAIGQAGDDAAGLSGMASVALRGLAG